MTEQRRMIEVSEFLTQAQAKQACVLWAKYGSGKAFIEAVAVEIIEPNLAEIDRKLGQKNDPRFLAYAVEHVLIQACEQR